MFSAIGGNWLGHMRPIAGSLFAGAGTGRREIVHN
jgi:hypothetical protein